MLLNVHLNHFPKHEKYGLSQSIRQAAYDVYTLLVEGQKRYHNKTTLSKLDVKHEQLRMLVNLLFGSIAFTGLTRACDPVMFKASTAFSGTR